METSTPCIGVSFVEFEQVNAGCVKLLFNLFLTGTTTNGFGVLPLNNQHVKERILRKGL